MRVVYFSAFVMLIASVKSITENHRNRKIFPNSKHGINNAEMRKPLCWQERTCQILILVIHFTMDAETTSPIKISFILR